MKNLLTRLAHAGRRVLSALRSMIAPAYIIVGLAVASGAVYLYQVDQSGEDTATGLERETLCNTQWKDQFTLAQGERLTASTLTTQKLREFYVQLRPVTASILKSFETGRQEVSEADAKALLDANNDIIEFMDEQTKIQNKYPYPNSECPPQPAESTTPESNSTMTPTPSPTASSKE